MPASKLSIVLPVRNREQEIIARVERVFAAIESLNGHLAEIIVVDDGSNDFNGSNSR